MLLSGDVIQIITFYVTFAESLWGPRGARESTRGDLQSCSQPAPGTDV